MKGHNGLPLLPPLFSWEFRHQSQSCLAGTFPPELAQRSEWAEITQMRQGISLSIEEQFSF